jgi:hypothetical protein
MNGRSQMQGRKNWILPKELNAALSSETLVGWSWKNHLCPSIWDRMEGAWLWLCTGYVSAAKSRLAMGRCTAGSRWRGGETGHPLA